MRSSHNFVHSFSEFKESFFRAAPYFDLNIDGITLPEGM